MSFFSTWNSTRAPRVRALVSKMRHVVTSSQGRRQVAANSGWLLFDKLARALLGLLVGAWVARYLGPAQFGLLAYVVAFIALFQAVANVGGDAIVVRDISQDRGAANEILGTALALRFGLGVACWMTAVACVAAFNPGEPKTILMAAIVGGALVFQSADTVDLWFQSESQSRRTVVAKLCAYCLSNGVKVVLVVTGAPLMAFAAVTAFDAFACAISLTVAYRQLPTPQAWRVVGSRALRLLSESWSFMLSGIAIMAYMRIDQIMVKEMLGDRALGIYAAALPLSQFWQVIPITISTSLAPFIARRRLAGGGDYRRALVLTYRTCFYLGVASVALTWLVSDVLVRRLFGSEYREAVAVLDIHSISNIFCFLGVAHGLWLVNERLFAARLFGTLLAGVTAVGVNLILLPRVGVVGAAYAAISAQIVACFLINLFLDPPGFRMQVDAITFAKA